MIVSIQKYSAENSIMNSTFSQKNLLDYMRSHRLALLPVSGHGEIKLRSLRSSSSTGLHVVEPFTLIPYGSENMIAFRKKK